MKIKSLLIPFLFMTLFLFSCASAPEEPQEAVETEAPAEEVSSDDAAMKEAKAAAESARSTAVEVHAPKAAAEEFDSAQSIFDKAEEAENQNDYDKATELFNQAAAGFKASADSASKAREAALEAMAEADKVIGSSETAADEATKAALEEE